MVARAAASPAKAASACWRAVSARSVWPSTPRAVISRAQLPELERRVTDGRANHDYVAERLNASPFINVPAPLGPELRAPDSIQFNMENMTADEIRAFSDESAARGVKVQVFGMSTDNARAFWNWQFIPDLPELPQTRSMLMKACDVRLPVRLTRDELDVITDILLASVEAVMGDIRAYGT